MVEKQQNIFGLRIIMI